MKRWPILSVFIFVFFIAVFSYNSSALYDCTDANTILRLSSEDNAHGALWDYGKDANPIRICYNDLFGEDYNSGQSKIHECSNSNTVLKLSSGQNAHGEDPSGANYGFEVCFGDLVCRMAQSTNPEEGEVLVVALSDRTNAHFSVKESKDYPFKIYCKRAEPGEKIQNVYWANYAGERIYESNTAYLGNIVKLIAKTTYPEGTIIKFEIKEENLGGTRDDVKTLEGTTDKNGNVVVEQRLDEDMMSYVDGNNEKAEFIFIAKSGADSKESSRLYAENKRVDRRPELQIVSPEHRQVYFKDTQIAFEGKCIDREGPVEVDWRITEEIDNSNIDVENKVDFDRKFNKVGQKTITAVCSDESGLTDEKQIGILIIGNNEKIFGFINQPKHLEIVKQNGLEVDFSASESYVIRSGYNTDACNGAIECLAGECPLETKNHPDNCDSLVSIDGTPKEFNGFKFDWTFEIGGEEIKASREGSPSVRMPYGKPSSSLSDYKIVDLNVIYGELDVPISVDVKRKFILLGRKACIGEKAVLTDDQGFLTGLGDCNAIDENGLSYSCCGAGKICETGSDGVGRCIIDNDLEGITACANYTTEDSCLEDEAGVGFSEKNPEWNADPACGSVVNGKVVQCINGCVWRDESNENGGTCYLEKTLKDLDVDDDGQCTPLCLTSAAETVRDCNEGDGFKTINIKKSFETQGVCSGDIGSPSSYSCTDEEAKIKCVQGVALPFFGAIGFILSSVSIILIYFVLMKAHATGIFLNKKAH